MPATVTPKPTPVGNQTPDVSAWVSGTRLVYARNVTYEDKANDLGSGSFEIPVLSVTASERSGITYGTLVTFKEFGSTVRFVMVVEEIAQTTVASGEESEQMIVYSGRSTLAELDRAIVYPPGGIWEASNFPFTGLRFGTVPFTDVRYWNWASPTLDRTSWGSPYEFITQSASMALPPSGMAGGPEGWPDGSAKYIMPTAPTSGAHSTRIWYAYATLTLSAMPYTDSVDLFASAGVNDAFEVWVDGTPVIVADAKDGTKTHRATIRTTVGSHKVVAKITHSGDTSSGNITGFLMSVFDHYNDGYGLTLSPHLRTQSSGWKVLNNPASSPGFTVADIVAELVNEAKTRGVLTPWTLGFTAPADTAGQTSPSVVEWSCQVGTKVSDALRSLAENFGEYGVDFTTNNGRRLRWWIIKGDPYGAGTYTGRGTASGVSLTPGVNVLSMRHHDSGPEVTSFLSRWDFGYSEFPDTVAIAAVGRFEAFLSSPETKEGTQALYMAARQLGVYKTQAESIEDLTHQLTSSTLYSVGDTVTAPNRAGSSTTWRVVARAVGVDDDGNGQVTAQLGVVRDDELSRIDRWNRKNLGTLDGRSETATVTSPAVAESAVVSPVELSFSTGGSGVTIVGDRGTPQRPDEPFVITRFEAETDIPGASGSTTARIEVDGVSIGTVTLSSGADFGYTNLSTKVLVNRANYVNIETTAAGGAQGMTVRVIGCPAK